MDGKKPLKAKNLKVIDYKGTLFATFDGSAMWKIDKVAFGIMRLCDGKRTYEQIVEEVARKANLTVEDTKIGVNPIFDELTSSKFIEWID